MFLWFADIKSWKDFIYVRGKRTLNCVRGNRTSETAGLCGANIYSDTGEFFGIWI